MSTVERQGLSPDEAVGFVPVSGLAVTSFIVAAATGLAIAGYGVYSHHLGKPAFQPMLLVPATAGLVLAVLAGWRVRNSEGALTGARLANAAFWVALLTIVAYVSYLVAI